MMMNNCILGFFLLITGSLMAQWYHEYPPYFEGENVPKWAEMLYGENPNYNSIKEAYRLYYTTHKFKKTDHTRYYERWKRRVEPFVDENGNIEKLSDSAFWAYILEMKAAYENKNLLKSALSNDDWEELDPWDYDHDRARGTEGIGVIIKAFQAPSNRDYLYYVSTMSNGLFRSTDRGEIMSKSPKNDQLKLGIGD